ncbi:MAG: SDR family NAD(P)-dependent oxidoreductase [Deltaproteobacteria bacterium]|nr:SDR family NAD(P)-dependent oxidoreductase [Deltaproteobacteria bacterium]
MSENVLRPGHVAVVTGAASGIGAALAAAFGELGMRVVLADVEAEALERVASMLRAKSVDALALPTDVADAEAVDRLARTSVERFGRVDVLCNNAGVSTFNALADQTLADWRWVLDVNLWGVVHGIRSFMPILRAQGRPAHIVSTSSVAGLWSGVPFIGPYAVSKVGVVSLSETLRDELQAEGSEVRVSVLCPGSVTTNVMEAERNRPAALGSELRTPVAEQVRLMIRDGLSGPDGKSPEQVAAIVLEGIRRDRFWILTHATTRAALEARFAAILAAIPED